MEELIEEISENEGFDVANISQTSKIKFDVLIN